MSAASSYPPRRPDWPYLRGQAEWCRNCSDSTSRRSACSAKHGILGDIFAGAQNRFSNPVNLHKLIGLIDETEWTALDVDVKAAAFEGLLEKAAAEGKKGAGQYFTPRVLIQTMVRCIKPDPRAQQRFRDRRPSLWHRRLPHRCLRMAEARDGRCADRDIAKRVRTRTYYGQELVARPRRLALMNLYLHQVEPHMTLGDSIYELPGAQRFDVILTNPPFGTEARTRPQSVMTLLSPRATSNSTLYSTS